MKFNIIHIIICIFVFVGCTQQTVNNSVECFTIKESGSSLVYCSDTLKSKIQMEIIKGHYTVETKEVFAIVSNPKHLSLGYDSAWNLEKWENSQWIILDKKKLGRKNLIMYKLFLMIMVQRQSQIKKVV